MRLWNTAAYGSPCSDLHGCHYVISMVSFSKQVNLTAIMITQGSVGALPFHWQG